MDYLEHPDSKHMTLEKVEEHIPEWYQKWQEEKQQFQIYEEAKGKAAGETQEDVGRGDIQESLFNREPVFERETERPTDAAAEETQEPLALDTPMKKRERMKTSEKKKTEMRITKVEDLFADHSSDS